MYGSVLHTKCVKDYSVMSCLSVCYVLHVSKQSQSYCCTVLRGICIDVELFLALIHTLQIDGYMNSVDEI